MIKAQKDITREYIKYDILNEHLGITDATEEEIDGVIALKDTDIIDDLDYYLANLVSFRAQLGVYILHIQNYRNHAHLNYI